MNESINVFYPENWVVCDSLNIELYLAQLKKNNNNNNNVMKGSA